MSKTRNIRDAIVGLLIALAPFAYEQSVTGNRFTAGMTVAVMLVLVTAYRYADARVIEVAIDTAPNDASELKPVLRRVGQYLRRLASRAKQ